VATRSAEGALRCSAASMSRVSASRAVAGDGAGEGARGGVVVVEAVALPHGEVGLKRAQEGRRGLGVGHAGGEGLHGLGPLAPCVGDRRQGLDDGRVDGALQRGVGDEGLGGGVPATHAPGDAHDGPRGAHAIAMGLGDLEVGLQGQGRVAALLLMNFSEPEGQGRVALEVSTGGCEGRAVRVDDHVPAVGESREARQLGLQHGAGVGVVGGEGQGARRVVQRAVGVVAAALGNLGGLHEQRGALEARGGGGEAGFEQGEQLGPVVGGDDGRGQHGHGVVGHGRHVQKGPQAFAGPRLGGVDAERLGVGRETEGRVVAAEPVQVAHPSPEGGPSAGMDLVGTGAPEQGEQIVPAGGAGEQIGQGVDGLGVFAVVGLDGGPGLDGGGGLVEPVGLGAGDGDEVGAVEGRVVGDAREAPEVGAGAQGLDEVFPALGAAEEVDEGVEGLAVGVVVAEACVPGRQRAVDVAQPVGELCGEPERDAARGGFGLQHGEAFEHGEALGLVAAVAEQRREAAGDGQAHPVGGARRLEHPGVQGAGADGVAEGVAAHVRGLHEQRQTQAVVLFAGRQALGGLTERVSQGGVVARGLGEVLQGREVTRGGGFEHDEGGHVGDGLGLLAVVEVAPCNLVVEADARRVVGGDGEAEPEHTQEVVGAFGGVVAGTEVIDRPPRDGGLRGEGEALQEGQKVGVVWGGAEQGLGGIEGLGAGVEVEPQGRDARPGRGHLVGREVGQPRLPQRDEIARPLEPLVQPLQRTGHADIAGVEPEAAFQVRQGALGVAGEVAGNLRGLVEQGHEAIAVAGRGRARRGRGRRARAGRPSGPRRCRASTGARRPSRCRGRARAPTTAGLRGPPTRRPRRHGRPRRAGRGWRNLRATGRHSEGRRRRRRGARRAAPARWRCLRRRPRGRRLGAWRRRRRGPGRGLPGCSSWALDLTVRRENNTRKPAARSRRAAREYPLPPSAETTERTPPHPALRPGPRWRCRGPVRGRGCSIGGQPRCARGSVPWRCDALVGSRALLGVVVLACCQRRGCPKSGARRDIPFRCARSRAAQPPNFPTTRSGGAYARRASMAASASGTKVRNSPSAGAMKPAAIPCATRALRGA
jgi:hypothetical protein